MKPKKRNPAEYNYFNPTKRVSQFLLLMVVAITMCHLGYGCTKTDGGNGGNGGDTPQPGLYVENGTLMKDNEPYYGMGINYFRLFNDYVTGDASTLRGLVKLAQAGVPFVRFPASPYWPISWTETYLKDKDAYFAKLDRLVEYAEEYGIGLIPSLFWHMPTFADISGEHMDAFGDSNSKTIAFIRQYTEEVVKRYKDSPAIWGWEFGNEFNLFIDIPHESLPPNPAGAGCPEKRVPGRDQFKNAHMINAFKEFGAVVRRYDKHRAIFSGNSEPRPAAWHLAAGHGWMADNYNEYKDIMSRFECDPINTITARAYCNYGVAATRYPLGLKNPSEYVAAMMKIAGELGKPLFIGEFGASDDWNSDELPEEYEKVTDIPAAFRARVKAIVDNKVPLSAVWVFDYPPQDSGINITFDNHRSYMIEELVQANRDLQNGITQ